LNVHGDLRNLPPAFDSGLGGFRFGMSPEQVNALLPRPFATVAWQTLPVAREYKTAEVRYFFRPLADFTAAAGGPFYEALPELHACWSGESYVAFEFTAARLIHISIRLLPDCADRARLLQQLAMRFSVPHPNPAGPVVFQADVDVVTVAGYTGDSVSSLDVFLTDSPQA
jgi:hypothetical protein